MACMTHQCLDCGALEFNNLRRLLVCPECGGENIHSTFDEPVDVDEFDRDDRDEEGEEPQC